MNGPLPPKKEQEPQWYSESDGGYTGSPFGIKVKGKSIRDAKRSSTMHRSGKKGDFPPGGHLDLQLIAASRRIRPAMETSTDERATPAPENPGLQLTNFLEQEQMLRE